MRRFRKILFLLSGAMVLLALRTAGGPATVMGSGTPSPEGGFLSPPPVKALLKGNRGYGGISFIENSGQAPKDILFLEEGHGRRLFITTEGLAIDLSRGRATPPRGDWGGDPSGRALTPRPLLRLMPLGMVGEREVLGEDPLSGRVNWFVGRDPSKWRRDIPVYGAVRHRNVYPGIDMKIYGNGEQVEYDLLVAPGADPGEIRLCYSGIREVHLEESGDMTLLTEGGGRLLQKRPTLIQMRGEERIVREGALKILFLEEGGKPHREGAPDGSGKKNQPRSLVFTFDIPFYDRTLPLIIDPVLVYATYLGGEAYDGGNSVARDTSGNIYVTGQTCSGEFPSQDPLYPHGGGADVFVTKFDPTGSTLLYATFLGGSEDDVGYGIAVDTSGNAYVTGATASTDFPTQDPLMPGYGGGTSDAFVAKLDAAGATLLYSTTLGGSAYDAAWGIAVGGEGNACVVGETFSEDFPTRDALFPGNKGYRDGFVVMIDPAGTALVYGTYLGGTDFDWARAVTLDAQGNAYITGDTYSGDFPVHLALFPEKNGYRDAFVTKIGPTGTSLVFSTFLGGGDSDRAHAVSVDTLGNVYVAGETYSCDFPVPNGLFQTHSEGISDAFVTKMNPTGTSLLTSTYLGGTGYDAAYGIAVDALQNVSVTGMTDSQDFPLAQALFPTLAGGLDAFVSRIDTKETSLVVSTYLGGSDTDAACGLAIDTRGNAWITGETFSGDFPFQNAPFPDASGDADAFVAQIELLVYAPPIADFTGTPRDGETPLTVLFVDTSKGVVTTRLWDFGDGTVSTEPSPSHVYEQPGSYTVSLQTSGPGGSDTETRNGFIQARSSTCVAEALAGRGLLGDGPEALVVLRAFRDGYLNRETEGKRLVPLYHALGERILDLLTTHPALLKRTSRVLLLALPALSEAVPGRPLALGPTLRREVEALIADIRRIASPDLRQALDLARGFLLVRGR